MDIEELKIDVEKDKKLTESGKDSRKTESGRHWKACKKRSERETEWKQETDTEVQISDFIRAHAFLFGSLYFSLLKPDICIKRRSKIKKRKI